MRQKKLLLMLTLLCTIVQGAWAEAGDTADTPITISSTEEWNTFVSNVNGGTSYSGKFVRLDADISVTEMAGSSETNSFQGTFLGGGHTLTFTKGSAEAAFGEDYCAPFRYTKDATIRDLNVAGDIYTSKKFAAGIVARPNGTTNITNCHVSTVIHSSVSVSADGGDGTHGGFTAYPQGNVNFTGCVYTGRMFTTTGSTKCGGFVGWHNGKTYTFVNSLYAPDPNITAAAGETAITTECATFVRGGSAGTGCYYTETMGEEQGTPAYTSAPDGEVSKPVTVNATTYYMLCTVSGVYGFYQYIGSAITVTPTVTHNGEALTDGTDYTVSTSPATVKELGDYTLTITGTGSCQGTKTIDFTVVDYLVKGKFTINNSGDMVKFVSGNLQATTTDLGKNWTWGFATNQWDHIGNATANNKINGTGTVSENGTIDLFSWVGESSENTGVAQYGITFTYYKQESEHGNVAGEKLKSDWGQLFGGAYRTLTNDEWDYVLNIRESGSTVVLTKNARYTQAVVNGVKGVILFPNEVNIDESEAISWGKINAPSDWKTECNAAQWAALEAKGCVFLPVTGYAYRMTLNGKDVQSVFYPDEGFYWSNTSTTTNTGIGFYIESGKIYQKRTSRRYCMAVRLVKDYETPYDDAAHTLTDADSYTREDEDMRVASATYQKTLGEDRVGKHQSWFVPFDYTIKEADTEKFDFYKINMIANAPNAQTDATDDIWVFLKKVDAGTMLHANMPYVYKPKKAVTDYAFTTENATLKAKATDARLTMMTAEDTYTLYGTYEPKTATAADPFYYVNINGKLSYGDAVTVGAFRWIMRVESKFGNKPAYARQMVFFDGEEATGIEEIDNLPIHNSQFEAGAWYTLDGRKLDGKPTARGLYINNGKKIVIK